MVGLKDKDKDKDKDKYKDKVKEKNGFVYKNLRN